MHRDIGALADRLVALRFEQDPLEAAMLGLDENSPGLGDASREANDRFIRAYSGIAVTAEALAGQLNEGDEYLDERDILSLDVISHSATDVDDEIAARLVELTVSGFQNSPVVSLVSVLPQLPL